MLSIAWPSRLVDDGLGPVFEPLLLERALLGASRAATNVQLTSGNCYDMTQLLRLVDGIGAIEGKRGRPR